MSFQAAAQGRQSPSSPTPSRAKKTPTAAGGAYLRAGAVLGLEAPTGAPAKATAATALPLLPTAHRPASAAAAAPARQLTVLSSAAMKDPLAATAPPLGREPAVLGRAQDAASRAAMAAAGSPRTAAEASDWQRARRIRPDTSLYAPGSFVHQRLLFLDIDGVLNTFATLGSSRAVTTNGWPAPISRPLLARLKRVLERTNALVVLSTAWRLDELGRRALQVGLASAGIDNSRIVGATPYQGGGPRAHEISAWLQTYGPCAAWAAVDDIDLWSESPRAMESHAVRTSLATGLTVDAAREVVRNLLANGDGGDLAAAAGVAGAAKGEMPLTFAGQGQGQAAAPAAATSLKPIR